MQMATSYKLAHHCEPNNGNHVLTRCHHHHHHHLSGHQPPQGLTCHRFRLNRNKMVTSVLFFPFSSPHLARNQTSWMASKVRDALDQNESVERVISYNTKNRPSFWPICPIWALSSISGRKFPKFTWDYNFPLDNLASEAWCPKSSMKSEKSNHSSMAVYIRVRSVCLRCICYLGDLLSHRIGLGWNLAIR